MGMVESLICWAVYSVLIGIGACATARPSGGKLLPLFLFVAITWPAIAALRFGQWLAEE